MRILISALLGAILMLGVSCEKSTTNPNEATDRKFVSMKLDNRIYLAEKPQATIYTPNLVDEDPNNDYLTMEILATTYSGDNISFKLATDQPTFVPGVYYTNTTGNSMTMYLLSQSGSTLVTDPTSSGFTITISRINSLYVEGTFSGTLNDATGGTGTRTVRDGSFRSLVRWVQK
ncbi:hypothetical protein [Chitinophaga sp. Cy-1792]|uniref:hypothetical protein n=1 Tax=Chitinophaga sp. Cy-1792 TaxID=2608339 RepID=UPI00141EBB7D|nr:hypothetical protein [Chitinophaga sp. Cy-1792]NIG52901.1 hypothetical protein [Chitinophaga sp. Cy-1792]